jgi:hypothetical protein
MRLCKFKRLRETLSSLNFVLRNPSGLKSEVSDKKDKNGHDFAMKLCHTKEIFLKTHCCGFS